MMRDVKQGLEKASEGAKSTPTGWAAAVALTERWLAQAERVDTLLEGLAPGLSTQERARAQQLFYGVVRWSNRLEAALDGLMTRPPRAKVRALLLVAGFELLEEKGDGGVAKVPGRIFARRVGEPEVGAAVAGEIGGAL